MNEVKATTRTLGVLFPNNSQEGKEAEGSWSRTRWGNGSVLSYGPPDFDVQ
jgi:hypothetical protein